MQGTVNFRQTASHPIISIPKWLHFLNGINGGLTHNLVDFINIGIFLAFANVFDVRGDPIAKIFQD